LHKVGTNEVLSGAGSIIENATPGKGAGNADHGAFLKKPILLQEAMQAAVG
jgi:hypothetical protein